MVRGNQVVVQVAPLLMVGCKVVCMFLYRCLCVCVYTCVGCVCVCPRKFGVPDSFDNSRAGCSGGCDNSTAGCPDGYDNEGFVHSDHCYPKVFSRKQRPCTFCSLFSTNVLHVTNILDTPVIVLHKCSTRNKDLRRFDHCSPTIAKQMFLAGRPVSEQRPWQPVLRGVRR